VALAVLAGAASPAAAQVVSTSPAPGGPAARSTAPATPPPISDEAVAEYADQHDVAAGEAQTRLTMQRRFAKLPVAAHEDLQRTAGPVRFDNETGDWIVPLTRAADATRVRATISDLGIPADRVRFPAAERSASAVRKATDEAFRALGRDVRAGDVTVDGGSDSAGPEITVDVAAAAAVVQRAEAVAADTGGKVVRAKAETWGFKPQFGCGHPYCDQLTGGVKVNGTAHSCTAGFYVGDPSGANRFLLTAGHCLAYAEEPWWSCFAGGASCHHVGAAQNRMWGPGHGGDSGLIRVTNAGWNMHPGYAIWNAPAPYTSGISTIRGYYRDPVHVGAFACHNGATTGTSCGTVASNSYGFANDSYPQGVIGMLRITGTCSNPGDSGGPWTMAAAEVAVGVHSGSVVSQPCNGRDSVAEPVGRALATTGTVIYGG
jgi:streptogrisin C